MQYLHVVASFITTVKEEVEDNGEGEDDDIRGEWDRDTQTEWFVGSQFLYPQHVRWFYGPNGYFSQPAIHLLPLWDCGGWWLVCVCLLSMKNANMLLG